VKAVPSVILVAFTWCLSCPGSALAQRSGAGRGGGHAARGDGDSGGHATGTSRMSSTRDHSDRGSRSRAPAPAARGGIGFSPLFWWPFAEFQIPSAIDANDAGRETVDAPPLPPANKPAAESSLIQPLLPLQPPRTPLQSAHGNLQLEVGPDNPQVYVDGFYAGSVRDASQLPAGLNLTAGWHRLEFRAPGYETAAANVTIEANRTISYKNELKAIRP
jgi:hypothetical protein